MNVTKAIEIRRAYRVLAPIEITDEIINSLADAAKLAPSCYNKQPWNFIFVRDKDKLMEMREALSKGNEWIHDASMIIAVFSKKEDDCMVEGRNYYLFDTGLAVGQLLLKATEMGLVAHPIAGFSESKAKEILNIPDEMKCITLVNVGLHDEEAVKELPEKKRLL